MRLNYLLTLSGLAASIAARVLPLNASLFSDRVQTAGLFDGKSIASDADWNKYRGKGSHYQCLFQANDEVAGMLVEDTRTPPSAQSIWRGTSEERAQWNWHENTFDESYMGHEILHLEDAFEALNIDGRRNVGWALGHYDEKRHYLPGQIGYSKMIPPVSQTYTVDGKIYMSSGGFYIFVVNQRDGAIVALNINSPKHASVDEWENVPGGTTPADLPKLQYSSDLIWGKWVQNNYGIKRLRVYMADNVINAETVAVVARALRDKKVTSLGVWPGTQFEKERDEEAFQAIIGSPIGGTISIMLAQHKAELGNKEIFQVNIIGDEPTHPAHDPDMHLVFQIRDVPLSNPGQTPAR
ncbi:hypothetical protein C7974DRAFT_59498 [Boeremia exigua]|uniref:uncharacterized protein n=1 Tax=Boeremia exigua TaxID=749465 RepID=UPI001E8D2263|nr:uncharacterized protein C7974DRAFT_59498 [Boeremia exigua]KAH6615114.1 hypothetical protein C7974DRAFT_59498 [Boeremia exigua]